MKFLRRLIRKKSKPSFPYFIDTAHRYLSESEKDVIQKLLQRGESPFFYQIEKLHVVGRCGCGKCPTIFFEK
jgi:hypothetical protein